MGNKSEFDKAISLIKASFPNDFDIDKNVSVFETNIRMLGGLLSGHMLAISDDPQLRVEG
jgi:mannosidase alpha-like ER degradation enhancer 2